jgi:hypothetical protein
MTCRICLEDETEEMPFIHPCKCIGTMGNVHLSCIQRWITVRKEPDCELCLTPFDKSLVKIPLISKEFYYCLYAVLLGCIISFAQAYMIFILMLFHPTDIIFAILLFMLGSAGHVYLHILLIGRLLRYTNMILIMPIIWYLTFIIFHSISMMILHKKMFSRDGNIVLFTTMCVFALSMLVGLRAYIHTRQTQRLS